MVKMHRMCFKKLKIVGWGKVGGIGVWGGGEGGIGIRLYNRYVTNVQPLYRKGN
jgi:hypothetical protein